MARVPIRRPPGLLRQASVAAALAVLVLGVAVAGNLASRPGTPPATLPGAAAAAALFRGIPQQGTTLGRADAPLTLAIYVDPQCPYCGDWDRLAFPALVARYVRLGTLRAEFRGLAFVGPDSERGLRALLAAGEQNRLFEAQSLLFSNQGVENSGWLSDAFVSSLAASVRQLDVARLKDAVQSPSVDAAIAAIAAQQSADGVDSTPTILVGPTGGTLTRIDLSSLDAPGTIPAIEQAIAELPG
jgi:protein-disulfide isomerase